MSSISSAFARCRKERRAALIPYLTAGHPSLETTERLLTSLVVGGADLIELGMPFSDPIADGPINQAAAARALAAGTTLSGVLELVARSRDRLGVPIVLFTYFNPIYAYGIDRFAEQASASGLDGVLFVDLPPEEGEREVFPELLRRGIHNVSLVAPTSTRERVRKAAASATGFVYYVSRAGVTGDQTLVAPELVRRIKSLRRRLSLPLVVGFGISTPEQAAALGRVADGVVVGSALVRLVEEHAEDPSLYQLVEERMRELARGVGDPRAQSVDLTPERP